MSRSRSALAIGCISLATLALPSLAAADKPATTPTTTPTTTAKPAGTSGAPAGATGKLNREEFEEALKPYLKDMHACYEKALKKDALVEGTVILKIDTKGGKVTAGDTDRDLSTLKLEDAHKCIIAIVKKMKMPLAKNDKGEHDAKLTASVTYPVEFSLGIDVDGANTKITGAKLDYDKVKKVFFYEKLAIGRCYLDAYKAKKGVAAVGKLILKIAVAGGVASSVDEVTPDTTVTDADLKKCVFAEVKKFKFPVGKDAKGADDPKAASTITYPLEFKAM